MHIGVMSDSHDHLPAIHAALHLFERRNVHALIHAGDFIAPFAARPLAAFPRPLFAVFGNNDGERRGLHGVLPHLREGPLLVTLDSRAILVHHFLDWCAPWDVHRADVVITGHTHEVVHQSRDGRLFLNPGECCGYLTGRCTVAILDTRSLSAEIIDITDDLKPR